MNFIKRFFLKSCNRDQRYAAISLLENSKLQNHLEVFGYAVGGVILNLEDIKKLENIYTEMLRMENGAVGERFLASGGIPNKELREYVLREIHKVTSPRLRKYVNDKIGWVAPGIFQIKPASKISQLDPHQDAAVVDETKYYGVYAWISLVDSTIENGCLYMLPGSHRIGNIHRSLTLPWQFQPQSEVMYKYLKPIPVKAGQVIFFDNATIHYSPPNLTQQTRVAVTNCILPKGATVITHFADEKTPKDMIEIYAVDQDFWNNCDILKRPPERFPFLGFQKHRKMNYTDKELVTFFEKYI